MSAWKFEVPATDAGANDKYQQFATNFVTVGDDLGFQPEDIAAVTAAANAFSTALTASNAAKDASKVATEVKRSQGPATNTVIRKFVDLVILDDAATPAQFALLGITPATSYAGPVVPPVSLASAPKADGSCRLTWSRASNAPGTVWVVEVAVGSGTFAYLATSSRTSYVDDAAEPGIQRTYRVSAQRNGETSLPSSSTTIYPSGEGEILSLAA